ncbi:unnamed protein product, partial [Iphiclides podalirius]
MERCHQRQRTESIMVTYQRIPIATFPHIRPVSVRPHRYPLPISQTPVFRKSKIVSEPVRTAPSRNNPLHLIRCERRGLVVPTVPRVVPAKFSATIVSKLPLLRRQCVVYPDAEV